MNFIKRNTIGEFTGLTKGTKTIIWVVSLILFFFIFCFRTVGAGEVGIITRFGDINRTATSGIALKLPWPIEGIQKMETRVKKDDIQSAAATSDLQDVQATITINHTVDNATAIEVYKEVGVDYIQRVIVPIVQESFKAASAKYSAQELITKRAEVKQVAYNSIKERLDKYGIRVVDVSITNFTFSKEFNDAIEAVQVANQNIAKARQELETTKIEAEKTIATASAQAEAQRLQQQTLTPELLQKYAIDKWNGVLPTTNAGQNTIFSIPVK